LLTLRGCGARFYAAAFVVGADRFGAIDEPKALIERVTTVKPNTVERPPH
jgi:hypothetical protein